MIVDDGLTPNERLYHENATDRPKPICGTCGGLGTITTSTTSTPQKCPACRGDSK